MEGVLGPKTHLKCKSFVENQNAGILCSLNSIIRDPHVDSYRRSGEEAGGYPKMYGDEYFRFKKGR